MIKPFTFRDIAWEIPEKERPLLDRTLTPMQISQLSDDQCIWAANGVLRLRKLIPASLIEKYQNCWLKENSGRLGGWPDCTPYLRHPEVRDLALHPPLMRKLKELIGMDMGLHLNLTGWVSTRRDWHSDVYLNPDQVKTWYVAVWIALEDIRKDSGPFEYVRGSHRWGATNRDKLFQYLPEEMRARDSWPAESQESVSRAFQEEIARRGCEVNQFLGEKGDVLIWHGALAHRGSIPTNPESLRRAFIGHYSSLEHRSDMPHRKEHSPGCWMFTFSGDTNGNV